MNYSQPIIHIIRKGDMLYELAMHYQTTVQDILALNKNINPQNLQIGSKIMIQPGPNFNPHQGVSIANPTVKSAHLVNEMRKVWSQHVYWTRLLLISIAERLQDQNATAQRLLRNPRDIARIFSSYYPANVTNSIINLLSEHLQIGAALITALRDGQQTVANQLTTQWYQNADKMAEAFASINPHYNYETLQRMLYKHLELTTKEVSERLAKNYQGDIDAFDLVEQEALEMADMFSNGIIAQFPQHF